MIEKRPREYAAEIINKETREERVKALEKVPDNLKPLVKAHVEDAFNKRKMQRVKSHERH